MGASITENEDVDDDSNFQSTHEINVTPFIDVILVLLIIFMVAAPLSTVDLADRSADLDCNPAEEKYDKPTYVSIKPDLAIAIGEELVKRVDLVRSLDAMPDSGEKDQPYLHSCRPRRALRRVDRRVRDPARRRLQQDQAGGAGRRSRTGGAAGSAGNNRDRA